MAKVIDASVPLRGEDLTGRRFGKLVVVGFAGVARKPNGHTRKMWSCRCDCGEGATSAGEDMKSGHTTSCGCVIPEASRRSATTHGLSSTPLYHVWSTMLARCQNRRNKAYKHYGGRGIAVCDRWLSFNNFYDDMSAGYCPGVWLDRVNNNGAYCRENCRWATPRQQNNNRRDNAMLELNGERRSLTEWSRMLNLPVSRLKFRRKMGWADHEVLEKETYRGYRLTARRRSPSTSDSPPGSPT